MKRALPALMAVALLPVAFARPDPGRAEGDRLDLSAYLWRARVLVLSAASSSDPDLAQSRRLLAERRGEVAERDLVVVEVLRPGPFTVRLVGKDGGEKLRRGAPVDLDELFAVIDAMPMRQEERRQRGSSPR